MFWAFSFLCDIVIGLFEFQFDVGFVVSQDSVKQFLGSCGGHILVVDLSSALSGAHKLRVSNLKHKDSCLHHVRTLWKAPLSNTFFNVLNLFDS